MATYKKYSNSQGEFWQVRGYLGVDEETGEKVECRKRGFQTKKEATAYYKEQQKKFLVGDRFNKEKKSTFEQVYHEWLEIYKNDVQDSTLSKTKNFFRLQILPVFGKSYIDKINAPMVQKTLNKWQKKYKNYRKIYGYFSRVIKYAYVQGYITKKVTDKVIMPKRQADYCKKEKQFYTRDELRQLMTILEQQKSRKWHACIRTLAYTGLRRGEILALTWNDIDFKNKTLTVDKAIGQRDGNELYLKPPKNANSLRTISVDDITLNVLKKWRAEQGQLLLKMGFNLGKDQLIFNNTKTNGFLNLGSIYNAFKRICEENNFRFIKIHGFRHTHCSLLFEAGVPMKDVMKRLGHGDVKTTMNIYAHVTEQSEQKSAQLFASYVNF
ncbi:site-specific integrase [Aerococcus sp. Group 1]|uniref:site-specific integrase n=1 Tax=Aerococcus urinae (strain CCUG 59500 / ACS-120-V-Col10a) TaxID=2976812 RepID=UPI00227A491B|nr:site-specific integrase [Aerococcus sp. Group 1]MCY3031373.1 site-specific integrase [Aerococcus sp. Group 1]